MSERIRETDWSAKLINRKNFNFEDVKTTWFAGVKYGENRAQDSISDSNVQDFWTWLHNRFDNNEMHLTLTTRRNFSLIACCKVWCWRLLGCLRLGRGQGK